MGEHIDKLYSGLKTSKDHILTEEAAKKHEELSRQWKELTKELTDEEKTDYIYLRVLFEEFLNTCCKDHFSKGFESGVDVTFKLTDRYFSPLYNAVDDEDESDNK